jgi:hypothetical protein
MSGTTESAGRRRIGSLLTAGAIGALVLAGATACASSATTAGSSDSSTVPVSAGSSPAAAGTASGSASASAPGSGAASSSASAGAGSTPSNYPMIPSTGGIVVTPQAQVTAPPAATKLVAFTSAAHSADGRTLYLGIESQGGACGQYDVVVQQTGTTVSLGLVHLAAGARICPMYVTRMLVAGKLSAPLDGRRVIDLANGQTVSSPQVA